MSRKTVHQLSKTFVQLDDDARAESIGLLHERLADGIDLLSMIRHAHWNVKGPQFIGLHKMFDEFHEAIEGYNDLIAERLIQLGGYAHGTVREAADHTTLSKYPAGITAGRDHVEALARATGEYGGKVRDAIKAAEEAEDAGTQDMFTDLVRDLDKWTWFLEAHLQAES